MGARHRTQTGARGAAARRARVLRRRLRRQAAPSLPATRRRQDAVPLPPSVPHRALGLGFDRDQSEADMRYWLLKSEPSAYSWDQLVKDGRTNWSGVRNFQAANNLKAMKNGDRAFFYHSNEGLDIVGIVEIVRTFYPDPSDKLGDLALVRQSRLSVVPVAAEEWRLICKMAGVPA